MAKKILIVDDDVAIVETLKVLLGVKGYEVVTAADGQQGVDAAVETVPDLIFLDLFLPGMSGGEVYRAIRARDGLGTIPVVFLSSFAEKPGTLDTEVGEHIPEDMFMPKPVDPMALLERVASLL